MNAESSPLVVADGPPRIAAIVPCFRVKDHVLDVVAHIGPECDRIYVVDDACPEGTGDHVERFCMDPRVRVLRHAENQGVGGAVMTGYRAAIDDGCDILVKIDGDGQMDPALLPAIVGPIVTGQADYAKGNRFYDLANIGRMPTTRILGNVGLSFLTKLSAGYWDISIDERIAIYRRYVELALAHWRDDEFGRTRLREFLRWHAGFWVRYAPQRPDGSWPSMQARESAFDPRSPLEALFARTDDAALDFITDELLNRGVFDAPPVPGAEGR